MIEFLIRITFSNFFPFCVQLPLMSTLLLVQLPLMSTLLLVQLPLMSTLLLVQLPLMSTLLHFLLHVLYIEWRLLECYAVWLL
jgi:hypothetical protein